MNARRKSLCLLALSLAGAAACESTPSEPLNPTWADAAPVFRGECTSCHGWTAGQTGGGYRFDFFDVNRTVCGDAFLALGEGAILAGSPLAAPLIASDVVAQMGAYWPRMPPQPSPALTDWESGTIERWAARPVKGPPPSGNRPPTIAVSAYPATANEHLAFTAVIDDPDGDSVLGVIEANGYGFLMNRPGSFAVSFDTSEWDAGPVAVTAVLCDGWGTASIASIALGAVQVGH